MNLYVYGLIERNDSLESPLTGIAGQPVRAEPVSRLYAIVSDFPQPAANADRENILTHERVLDAVLAQLTPLPFRFGTVVAAPQLLEFVETNLETLTVDLARVRGCVQMSVKILAKTETPSSGPLGRSLAEGEGPGVRFLKAKQAGRDVLVAAANELNEAMAGLLRSTQTKVQTTPRFMASVAHLVERAKMQECVSRFRAVSASRPDIAYMQSGPWPPYSFVTAGLALQRSVRA